LLEDYPEIKRTKTDVFRDRVRYSEELKQKVAAARQKGLEASRQKLDKSKIVEPLLGVQSSFEPLLNIESAVIIDLFLSFRAVSGWAQMVDLAAQMPRPLAETVLVQEQLSLALNRLGRGDEAERVLTSLIQRRGPSSESYGILGRVYKDRWEQATKEGDTFRAAGLLDKAIDTYLRGFEADWRDAYPGVNAVTLMELKSIPDPRRNKLIPLVAYAVERRIADGKPDYWDYATLLELAVLAKDQASAELEAGRALAVQREPWEGETTSRNLRLIRLAREKRGEDLPWARAIERALFPANDSA
jgi:hypothetical protein